MRPSTHQPPCDRPTLAFLLVILLAWAGPTPVSALQEGTREGTTIRIMPPQGASFAVDQQFDIRVEATAPDPEGTPPRGLRVWIDDREITGSNILDPGVGGEPGAGGTGSTRRDIPVHHRAAEAPAHTTNFLVRDQAFDEPGTFTIRARTEDGAEAAVEVAVESWHDPGSGVAPVRNVIILVADGMGVSHRTAARLVSRTMTHGKVDRPLAMDMMEVTGLVMTPSLNSVITDSAPGMAALSTGHKASNNQLGVYPDNTLDDAFDNPRVEYIGAMLRRQRGPGFNVGLVVTADVTDATPAANAVHTADRNDGPRIAARYFDERETNAVSVLMGGGSRHFFPGSHPESSREDERHLLEEFTGAGYHHISTATELSRLLEAPRVPDRLLGLFHPRHMPVAFDKVGAGRYSDELALDRYEGLRDQPMLDDMTRLALRVMEEHSPDGFYLMVEGASVDKQAHEVDAERTIWDTIEFDNAVQVALDYAARTNSDGDPQNQTLVIVASDHETGGMSIIGVGNERYHPVTLGEAVRDYAAVFRFDREQELNFFPNYEHDQDGFPLHPDPARKILIGWGSAPDRYENWISNRVFLPPATHERRPIELGAQKGSEAVVAVANPARSGPGPESDNRTMEGIPVPGFLVPGTFENGATGCPAEDGCPADTRARPFIIGGHTASDVPLSASGPAAFQFTGTYDNTRVFHKMLRAFGGAYTPVPRGVRREPVDLESLYREVTGQRERR
jgi:alkaline phosphatase